MYGVQGTTHPDLKCVSAASSKRVFRLYIAVQQWHRLIDKVAEAYLQAHNTCGVR